MFNKLECWSAHEDESINLKIFLIMIVESDSKKGEG